MKNSLPPVRVLVTGSSGFLGQYVVHELTARGCEVVEVCRSRGFNLLQENEVLTAVLMAKPSVIIHLAAPSLHNPHETGVVFRNTLKMGMHVLDASVMVGAKFVTVASRGIYTSSKIGTPTLFEECVNLGMAADAAGDAKRALAAACRHYYSQYKRPYTFLILSSLYGPLQHAVNFGMGSNTGLGFMIKSILDCSSEPEFAFSGINGEEVVEHLFVQEAAQAVVKAALDVDYNGVVNIPASESTSRTKLAAMIAQSVEYKGKIHFDEKSTALPFVPLSGDLATKVMKWKSALPLTDGLRGTVEWFLAERSQEVLK